MQAAKKQELAGERDRPSLLALAKTPSEVYAPAEFPFRVTKEEIMMRKLLLIASSLLAFVSIAMAQVKFDIKEHCPKESVSHKLDVGDVPDHSYWIGQGTCNATASDSGFPEKTSDYTEFRETWKASINFHGRSNLTMDNGDKVYITYEGSFSADITKPFTFKWKILSGTGKYKGIKGSGTTSMKFNADGSADDTGTGTYSLGK